MCLSILPKTVQIVVILLRKRCQPEPIFAAAVRYWIVTTTRLATFWLKGLSKQELIKIRWGTPKLRLGDRLISTCWWRHQRANQLGEPRIPARSRALSVNLYEGDLNDAQFETKLDKILSIGVFVL